jgi:hypothetical protein
MVFFHFQFGFKFLKPLLCLLLEFINAQTKLVGAIVFARTIVFVGMTIVRGQD